MSANRAYLERDKRCEFKQPRTTLAKIGSKMASLKEICSGLPIDPLPSPRVRDDTVPHAPVRTVNLSHAERRLALQNALRYFPHTCHQVLAEEFADELRQFGHIYMYRFRPHIEMRAYPIEEYPAKTQHAAAIMLMIMNNLDHRVAQFPHELVTYGGNGQVFSNWAQLKVFVTSGLGGMSGAQAKAAVIAGCIGVVAEVHEAALKKRHEQGWLMEYTSDVETCIDMIKRACQLKKPHSLGYHGNIVDLWERLVQEYESTGELLVDLGSDQTSLHNPFNGGYYPVQVRFDEANEIMKHDPARFKVLVQESLRRHATAINKLTARGMFFWDYGNAFLLEASRAGADVCKEEAPVGVFRYPSYVQDIMGDIFSMGFGPFRLVCLTKIEAIVRENDISFYVSSFIFFLFSQVVGSQARILYADHRGRISIAEAFNKAIAEKRLSGCIVISRDHHDVSGTDSPFRETSNIYDGSSFCADMAVQNAIGDSFRGATWVALHNGGGVGWGEVINGGFGLVLDGSQEAASRARSMLSWDVNNGVARRCWSGNLHAKNAICKAMKENPLLKVTIPSHVEDLALLEKALKS
ncbi:PREDICTED: urocanate hydratase-like [Acropora digitifera]|uniref:urocanate hydratase-like n=1 Tax=Acropora digitifera TaxID=70779 RepID=UPI00077AAF24|nr:PREDICTED: urocanate hydratase-like [Acropora digitifera]